MIEARSLTRAFRGVIAVEDLTLRVERGEVFGLLGPNGAGKTTTIRMLAGLLAPSSGEATVNGWRVGQDGRELRRGVGVLTEHPGLYERLSVRANLEFFARLYGLDGRELAGRVDRHLEMLGLSESQHQPAGRLSRGYQQKVALARALIHEPPVLFLDEPTSNLDPAAAFAVREAVRELRADRRCVVLCTHNLEEAEALCDRIGILKRRLLCEDSAANLRRERGVRQVVVQMVAYDERFAEAAQALPFVQACGREGDGLLVQLDDPERNNPRLLARLIEAGAAVQFVSERRPSLERVYLELVGAGHA